MVVADLGLLDPVDRILLRIAVAPLAAPTKELTVDDELLPLG